MHQLVDNHGSTRTISIPFYFILLAFTFVHAVGDIHVPLSYHHSGRIGERDTSLCAASSQIRARSHLQPCRIRRAFHVAIDYRMRSFVSTSVQMLESRPQLRSHASRTVIHVDRQEDIVEDSSLEGCGICFDRNAEMMSDTIDMKNSVSRSS